MNTTEQSPLHGMIKTMFERIEDPTVKTSKLAQIISFADAGRDGLLDGAGHPDNDWWSRHAIEDYSEIIVRANHKAQKMINGDLVPDDLDEQIKNMKENDLPKLIAKFEQQIKERK